MVHPFFMQG